MDVDASTKLLSGLSLSSDTEIAPRLPSDILLMVFEELQKTSSLRPLRLVSTQFEALVAPFAQCHVVLTPDLVAQYSQEGPQEKYSALLRQLSLYTKHVTIKQALHWPYAIRLLATLDKFEYLTWANAYGSAESTYADVPTLRQIGLEWPKLKYLVEGSATPLWRTLQIAKPAHMQIISCKIVDVDYWVFRNFKEFIVARPEMESLHLIGSGDMGPILSELNIKHKDRMPPLRELVLHHYVWNHSPETAVSFWDWTNVTRLELKKVPIVPFLDTVPPKCLENLQDFVTDGFCTKATDWFKATNLLSDLVSHIRALHNLSLTCHVGQRACVDAIIKHGKTLRSLELLNYYGGDGVRGPDCGDLFHNLNKCGLSPQHLEQIGLACPNLTTMMLNYRPPPKRYPGPYRSISSSPTTTLAAFRNLRRLVLHTWVSYHVDDEHKEITFAGGDENIRRWTRHLATVKHGAKFEELRLEYNVFQYSRNVPYSGKLGHTRIIIDHRAYSYQG